ncbi:MAG: hypothetical protein JF614_12115 [Acidobacteria bacterium]|nr:hypothetical protein [Acidobacteriota bacterium]
MGNTKADKRREELREQFWPDSEGRIWKGPKEKGYWCSPRFLPLILHLTTYKKIVGNHNCSTVYLDLFSRDFGQGIIEIRDEDEHAYYSGYEGSRSRRTWQERIHSLEKAGFIQVTHKGNHLIGYVLLIHPLQVAQALRSEGKIESKWWHQLQEQLRNIGAEPLSDPLARPELQLRVINGGVASGSGSLSQDLPRRGSGKPG